MGTLSLPDDLIQRIEHLAQRENRSPAALLESLLARYRIPADPAPDPDFDEAIAIRGVILRTYERARRYWREHGEPAKAALTDAEMDEQFWLIDHEGIPRLKSEQDQVDLPPDTLKDYAAQAKANTFYSGKTDTATRSREILNNEFADALINRVKDTHATEEHSG